MSVYAFELHDPIEPPPTFYGYEVLGYDEFGNAELTGEDYHAYVNEILSNQVAPVSALAVGLDEVKKSQLEDSTRFMSLIDWKQWVFDWAVDMLKNPTISAGEKSTVSSQLNSVGKKRIYYGYSGKYELIRCELTYNQDNKEVTYKITRSFDGAMYTYYVYSNEGSEITVSWASSGYTVRSSINSIRGGQNVQNQTPLVNIRMTSYSVNSLPVSTLSTNTKTAVPDNSSWILGANGTIRDYAENTFETNDYTYNLNHSVITNSNKYWNPATIYLPTYIPVSSGTEINQTNINNYSEYGYTWNDTTNSVDVDMDVLTAWVQNELIPQLELVYKGTYQDFPDIDVDITDQDIDYLHPFEEEEEETETQPPETYPPATGGGGGGGLTPSELESVLDQETYYILDMETGLPEMALDSLPAVENFPPEVLEAVGGISSFVIDLFSASGLLSVFMALVVLAFIVFAIRG